MKKLKKVLALMLTIVSCMLFIGGCGGSSSTLSGPINATNLYVNKSEITVIVGETAKLTATVDDGSTIEFDSLDPSVCSVDTKGKIVGLKVGFTMISVKANGYEKLCTINVVGDGYSIQFNQPSKINVIVGTTISLFASVKKYDKNFETTVTWNSEGNCATTTINNNTLNITTVSTGIFRVSAIIGQCTQTCEIKVFEKDATQLSAPNLFVEERKVKWIAVDNADGYLVKIADGQWLSTTETIFDVSNVDSQSTVFVKAICNGFTFFDSESAFIIV